MPEETLSVVDNRTGRRYEIPIRDGAIPATELQKITTDGAGTGKPALRASTTSSELDSETLFRLG